MTTDDQVTVTVSRQDLLSVLRWGVESPSAYRIRKAIPPKAWDPTTTQVDAYMSTWTGSISSDRVWAVKELQRLHAAGFDLTLVKVDK